MAMCIKNSGLMERKRIGIVLIINDIQNASRFYIPLKIKLRFIKRCTIILKKPNSVLVKYFVFKSINFLIIIIC